MTYPKELSSLSDVLQQPIQPPSTPLSNTGHHAQHGGGVRSNLLWFLSFLAKERNSPPGETGTQSTAMKT
jgi:hypothetical protein